jgi:anaerobic magnesium-protoporphyrin IX monomethyl ester cyclase
MNVLLVRPPSIMGREHDHALQHPINLCWLAAAAKQAGFNPTILDYEVIQYSPADFARRIAELAPGLIGFTSMTPSVDFVGGMAKVARVASAKAKLALGGAHTSVLPRETLREYPELDVAVVGEGEGVFADVCRAVAEGTLGGNEIPSAVIRAGDGTIGDPSNRAAPLDLDTLPLPARELLDIGRYGGAPTPGLPQGVFRATQLFTARGCAGKCIFCCSENVFGRRVRQRSTVHVMEEVRDCMDRFGFRHFTIDNDTFTWDRGRAMDFCGEISKLGVTWDCDTRVDRVDEELLNAMAESGCVKVAFGVETGSPRILELIKKGITLDQVRNAFRWTRRAGMLSCAFFMVGNHPEETAEDVASSRKFIREIDPDLISIAIATPYPGTELREIMRREGLLGDVPWPAYGQSFQGDTMSRTRTIQPARLKKLQSIMLREFYLRFSYILRRLARIRSPKEALYWAGAGFQFIVYLLGRRCNGRMN